MLDVSNNKMSLPGSIQYTVKEWVCDQKAIVLPLQSSMLHIINNKQGFPLDYSLLAITLEIIAHSTCAQRNANTLITLHLMKHW